MKHKMKKKDNNKVSSEPSSFGVILEAVDSKIDQMLEGYGALDKKIDINHGEFCEFRKEVNYKFDVVFEKFGEIDQKFEKIDQKFEKIDQKFEKIDQKFDMVFDELHLIRNDLKEKVSRDEFILLEKRVLILERKKMNG